MANLPDDPGVLDRVMQSVSRRRAEITDRCERVLQRAGSPVAWNSVMVDQFRAQVGRVLDDTVAMLQGGAAAEVVDQPDPASVEIGAHRARNDVHIVESIRAANVVFDTTMEIVVADLDATGQSTLPVECMGRLTTALNDAVFRRMIVFAKAYFATWLDQVHNGQAEQRLRIMRELTDASRDQLVGGIHAVVYDGCTTSRAGMSSGLAMPDGGRRPALTNREQGVIELAATAMTTKEIAEALHIAEGTARRHLSSAYRKLGATRRIDAVHQATVAGLIHPVARVAGEPPPGRVPRPRRGARGARAGNDEDPPHDRS